MRTARIVSFAAFAIICTAAANAAIIPNADFEDGLTNWSVHGTFNMDSGSEEAYVTTSGGVDGSSYLRLENPDSGSTNNRVLSDIFAITPPEQAAEGYDLSVWFRSGSLSGDGSVVIRWFDDTGSQTGWSIPFSGLTGSNAWTELTKHYDASDVPVGTTQADIALRLEYAGWYIGYDDVSFAAVPEPATMGVLLSGMALGVLRRRR